MFWRVLQFWRKHSLSVLVVLGLTAFVLGAVGWYDALTEPDLGRRRGEALYAALQLFTVQWSRTGTVATGLLQWARWLAALVSIGGLITVLLAAWADWVEGLVLRTTRDHIVICGLGPEGYHVAQDFLEAKPRRMVVIIEQWKENPRLEACRARGARVLIGDATDPAVLRAANAPRAQRVVAVCGDDSVNATVLASWRELPPRPTCNCTAHIADPRVAQVLRAEEATGNVVIVNLHGSAALVLLGFDADGQPSKADWSLPKAYFTAAARPHAPHREASAPNLLVLGSCELAESLVARAAQYHTAMASATGLMRITVAGPGCERLVDRLNSMALAYLSAGVVALDYSVEVWPDAGAIKGPLDDYDLVLVALEPTDDAALGRLLYDQALRTTKVKVVAAIARSGGHAGPGQAGRLPPLVCRLARRAVLAAAGRG